MITTNLFKRLRSITLPPYARLPLSIAVVILFIVPLAFYVEVGMFLPFSHSPNDWVQFATYLGGVTGPPLALIASWLVVVTVRESLEKTDQQTNILRSQMSMQEAGDTLRVALDIHHNILNQFEKSETIAEFVSKIERMALDSLWLVKSKPWNVDYEAAFIEQLEIAYIGMRSSYEDLIEFYMSSLSLCLQMLFKLDTREEVSQKSMESSQRATSRQIKIYLAMLSEEEIRLLLLEATYQARLSDKSPLGALLSWAELRRPIIPDYIVNDMSPDTCALYDGYFAIHGRVEMMRYLYIMAA